MIKAVGKGISKDKCRLADLTERRLDVINYLREVQDLVSDYLTADSEGRPVDGKLFRAARLLQDKLCEVYCLTYEVWFMEKQRVAAAEREGKEDFFAKRGKVAAQVSQWVMDCMDNVGATPTPAEIEAQYHRVFAALYPKEYEAFLKKNAAEADKEATVPSEGVTIAEDKEVPAVRYSEQDKDIPAVKY